MPAVHEYIGIFIVAAFGLMSVWGFGARLVKRDPGRWFWRFVAVIQVVVVVQILAGIVLLLLGHGRPLLHYAYGVFPALALAAAHAYARRPEEQRPWMPFAWAAFFSFGLTLRALMTGLGIG